MSHLLRITSSILGADSVSTGLSGELINALRASGQEFEVIDRNFQTQAIPHFDNAWLAAVSTPLEQRTPEQQAKAEFSDTLIAELKLADTIVIGLPMYNFSVPSMLKAWIDHVARAGVTFKYTEKGPVGLLQGKKVYFVASSGGDHEQKSTDFLRPYLQLVMNFIGITDIEIISASGLAIGPEQKHRALTRARTAIAALAQKTRMQSVATTQDRLAV